jgi:hypothetical protein
MARQLLGPYGSEQTIPQPSTGSVVSPETYTNLRQTLGVQGLKQGGSPSEVDKYLTWLKPDEMSDQERTRNSLEQRIALAEKLWFPNEDELALPKVGNWIQRQSHKLQVQYKASSAYTLFSKRVRTMGATLAKAAGDTGNIAWAEQAAQLKGMADADMTKEEAEEAFKNMRTSLGLEEKGSNYYNALRKGEDPAITSGIDPDELSSSAIDAFITPTFTKVNPQTGTVKREKSLKDLNLAQRVLGTEEETYRPKLPFSEYGGEIGSAAGMMAGKLLPTPLNLPGIRTLLGGMLGQTYENIGQQGIPLTREAANQQAGYNTASLNPLEVIPGMAKQTWNAAKPILPYAALDALIAGGGKQLLGGLRNIVASRAAPIAGEPIAQAGMNLAETGPASLQPSLQKLALQGIEKYSGRTLSVPEALNQATQSQNVGFTLAGGLKPTAAALMERAYAETMRQLISQSSPLAGYLTGGLSGASKLGGVAQSGISKLLLPLSIIFGSRYLGNKMGGY